jgi:dethiobiotin synthetase
MNRWPRGIFVTGTDTGVGKTELACGLLRGFADDGHSVVGLKPVAAGARRVDGELRNGDVEQLRRAANIKLPRREINPYIFAAAVAPHLAAQRVGVRIALPPIVRAFVRLAQHADVIVVEGVGGFLVPLNARQNTGDLVQRLRLPVLLVVGCV